MPSALQSETAPRRRWSLTTIGLVLVATAVATLLLGVAATSAFILDSTHPVLRRRRTSPSPHNVQQQDGQPGVGNFAASDVCGVTSFFNPAGFESKAGNYKRFSARVRRQGLFLILVELAYDDQPFALGGGLETADQVRVYGYGGR